MAHYLRQGACLVRPRPPPRGESHPGNHLLTVTQLPGCFPMLRRCLRRGGHHVIDIPSSTAPFLRDLRFPPPVFFLSTMFVFDKIMPPLTCILFFSMGGTLFFHLFYLTSVWPEPSHISIPACPPRTAYAWKRERALVGPPVHMTTSNFAVYFFWE